MQQNFSSIDFGIDEENHFYKEKKFITNIIITNGLFSLIWTFIYKQNYKKESYKDYYFDQKFCIICLFSIKTVLYKVLKVNYTVFLINNINKISI